MPTLLVRTDAERTRVICLRLGVNRLGSSEFNDFQIEDPSVSPRHCEIMLGDGVLTVRDCSSKHGTFVNGKPVQEASLYTGQTLYLGEVAFFVESTEVRIAIPNFDVARPVTPGVLKAGALNCPRHPKTHVTRRCNHCFNVVCDACVTRIRRRGGKTWNICPLCGHPCDLPIPAPPVRLIDGTLTCPRHPEVRATHQCVSCKEVLCDQCVDRIPRSRGKALCLCPLCGNRCWQIQQERKKKRSLFGLLKSPVESAVAKPSQSRSSRRRT